MAKNRRLVFVLAAATICAILLAWLAFNPRYLFAFKGNQLLLAVVACEALVPVYFLLKMSKRWPRLAIGHSVLAAGLVLMSVFVLTHYVLRFDNIWTGIIFNLSRALSISAGFIIIWQTVRSIRHERSKDHQ